MKNMVDRKSEQLAARRPSGKLASAHARIEQPGITTKDPSRVRPSHVVEVADYNYGMIGITHLLRDDHQFAIPLHSVLDLGDRWFGMKSEKFDLVA